MQATSWVAEWREAVKEGGDSGLAQLAKASKDAQVQAVLMPCCLHHGAAHELPVVQTSEGQLVSSFAKGAEDFISNVQASVEEADAEEDEEQQQLQQQEQQQQQQQQQRDRQHPGGRASSSAEHPQAGAKQQGKARQQESAAGQPRADSEASPRTKGAAVLLVRQASCRRLDAQLVSVAGRHADQGTDHAQPDTSREPAL